MRYCYALTAEQLDLIPALSQQAHVGFEIRLDTFSERPDFQAIRASTNAPLLGTYRSKPHLGQADPENRPLEGLQWRIAAAQAGFEWVDIELDEPHLETRIAEFQASGAKVVLSHHNLTDNRDLEDALHRAFQTRADLVKVIGSGRDTVHYTDQRRFYRTYDCNRLVMFYMGGEFAATRVLCLVYGGPFTFLTASKSDAVAPGQLTYQQITEIYNPTDINLKTLRLFAVIGAPIGHSKSPAFHNPILKKEDPNALFLGLHAGNEEDFARLEKTFPELCGTAVTKPMKEIAFRVADRFLDPICKGLGAANTLLFRDGLKVAGNTDLSAMLEILKEHAGGSKVRVLGYGGLGKAVVKACLAMDMPVQVTNRNPDRLADVPEGAETLAWQDRHQEGASVVVQCTSVGMAPNTEQSPMDYLPKDTKVLIETIYNPAVTELMRKAKAQSIEIVDGAALFDGQARIQSAHFLQTLKP